MPEIWTGCYAVQQRLDATRAALGDNVIQTTTVDPDDSYGGMIVLERIKSPKWPATIALKVSLGGESYDFAFRVEKQYVEYYGVSANPRRCYTVEGIGGSSTEYPVFVRWAPT